MKDLIQFLQDNWLSGLQLSVVLWEIIVRLKPSDKTLSLLTMLWRLLNAILPDKRAGGGTHIVIWLLMLLPFLGHSQNNMQGRAMYSWDASATPDTVTIKNVLTSYQTKYSDSSAAGLYWNKFSKKWRIWIFVCPDTSQHRGCWVDLPTSSGSGHALYFKNGLTKLADSTTVNFGGTITSQRSLVSGVTHVQDWNLTGEPTIGFNAANTSGLKGTNWTSIGNASNTGTGAIGDYSTAVGYNTKTRGLYGISVGVNAGSTTGADNGQSISIGGLANGGNKDIGDHSVAIGYQAETQGSQSIAIGLSSGQSSGSIGQSSITLGVGANSGALNIGDRSIAIGNAALSPSLGSISLGDNAASSSGTIGQDFVSIGSLSNQGAHNIGDYGVAMGYNSHSQGLYNISLGVNSGSSTGTDGGKAISIGGSANNTALANIGLGSTAIGYQVNSTATGALTIGYGNSAPTTNSTVNSFGISWDSATPDILLTKANGWKINGFYGHAGYVLTSDSTLGNVKWQPTSGGGTPAGADTQIQFNSAGSFGASSNFVYFNGSNPQLQIGSASVPILLTSDNSTNLAIDFGSGSGTGKNGLLETNTATSGNGGSLTIKAGSSTAVSSSGGNLYLSAGVGLSSTGFIILTNLPTTCSGAPTGALANVGGVLTICP